MSLTKQIFLYSVGTDAFYDEDEQYIHQRLLKLYKLRKAEIPPWKKSSVNRVIKKEKLKLIEILDSKNEKGAVRNLNNSDLNDGSVVSLFESSLTRMLGAKTNELTDKIIIVNVFFFQVFKDIVNYGFTFNGNKYRFLTASAGQIRTKKAVFIREDEYFRIEKTLMCGLTIGHINENGGINPN